MFSVFARNNRPRGLVFLLIGITVAAVSVFAATALVIVQASTEKTDQEQYFQHGVNIAEARLAGSTEVLAYINGHPLTVAEFLETRARVAKNLEYMRTSISRAVPDDEYSPDDSENGETTRHNLSNETLPETLVSGYFTDLFELIDMYGVDTVAFASRIEHYSALSEAIAANYTASDSELAAKEREYRAYLFEFGESSEYAKDLTAEDKGYIVTVGEDVFWTEILPKRHEQEIKIVKWRAAATEGQNLEYKEHVNAVKALDQKAVAAANIEVSEASRLNTTIEEALDYLSDYWALGDGTSANLND